MRWLHGRRIQILKIIARLFDNFVARNNYLCYNYCSEAIEDPCRKGLSFMKRRNTITLEITTKELELLKNSVQFSCNDKKWRLLEACEGGYNNDDGMIHIEPSKYEDYWQYENLMNTLKNAGPLPF